MCLIALCVISHYTDVIMGAIASQITSLTIVYSIVYSDADQRKHQSSASLAFVRWIHKRPVTRKMFPFDDVIMSSGTYDPILCRCAMSYSRCPPPLYHYISVPCEPVSSSVGAVTDRSELIFPGNKMAVKQSVQIIFRSSKLLILRRYFVRDFISIKMHSYIRWLI